MGMTHGNRLRTYKRQCPPAFSLTLLLTLLVTLVMQAGLARTKTYSHTVQILALQCVLGESEILRLHTRAHTHTQARTRVRARAHTHTHTHTILYYMYVLCVYICMYI